MKASRNILLELVRSALWERPLSALPEDVDWKSVIRLARQQTLLGLLADAVQALPQDSRPDEKTMMGLKSFVVRNIQSHMLISSRLSMSLELLRSAGIEPVLFKGHGLAMNYPDPMSRQCGDIDLYVGKERYDDAVNVFLETCGKGDHDSESNKHYHFDYQGVSVELHRIAETIPGVFADRSYQEWTVRHLTGPEFRKVKIDGVDVTLPPYRFDAIYILNHAWHHFVNGGIGLRQLCDWTMYLHRFHDRLDVSLLERDLKSFGLLKVWHFFAFIAVEHLGLPSAECPLYSGKYKEKSEMVMEIIWGDGNFGRYSEKGMSKRPEGYATGKIHSMAVTTGRYFRIFSIYPSHMLKAWMLFIISGIYHFFKGLL